MSQPRKHHFLPQFYLRSFSKDGSSLYQVEKKTGTSYGCRIKDLAAIRDFHEIDFDDAEDPFAVERELAKAEGAMSVHVKNLLRDGLRDKPDLLETIGFVSMLRMRVPAIKRHIEASLGATVRTVAEAMERQGKFPPAPAGLEEHLKVANLNIQITNWKCMELMFGMASNPDVLSIMCNMRAVLLRAPSGSFLTCDQPVALYHWNAKSPYGVGPATTGVEISVPLSSDSLLLLTHSDESDEEREASNDEILEFNRRTIVMADQYIYTSIEPAALAPVIEALRDKSAGFRFDMLPGVGGTYQIQRCVPVYPVGT